MTTANTGALALTLGGTGAPHSPRRPFRVVRRGHVREVEAARRRCGVRGGACGVEG
jgi:hypothetical protein